MHIFSVGQSVLGCFFDILFFLMLFLYSKKSLKRCIPQRRIYICLLIILLFCIFNFCSGDFYHYYKTIQDLSKTHINISEWELGDHLEVPYLLTSKFVNYHYYAFRIIIWGGALILSYLTAKRMNVDRGLWVFCFVAFTLSLFAYARVSLAMALSFYGMSLIVNPSAKNNSPSLLSVTRFVGIFLVVSSILFHKSAVIMLIIAPLSLLKINKKVLIITVIAFPVVTWLVNHHFFDYINLISGTNNIVDLNAVSYYSTYYENERGLGSLLSYGLNLSKFYALLILIVFVVLGKQYKELPYHIAVFFNAAFWIIVLSSVFATADLSSEVLFYRLLYYSIIPAPIILSFVKRYLNVQKLFYTVISLAFMQAVYMLLYAFYGYYIFL